MSVAAVVAVSLALTIGLWTPAVACPVGTGAGAALSGALGAVRNALGVSAAKPVDTPGAGAKAAAAAATGARAAGGGGSFAGGGGASFGGASGGVGEPSSGFSAAGLGTPYNPAADRAFSPTAPPPDDRGVRHADATSTSQPSGDSFALALSDGTGRPAATDGVKVASLEQLESPRPESWPVAMASPATESDPVSFDRDGALPGPTHAGRTGWLLGAALVGFGALGTGWAWRSLAGAEEDGQAD